MSRISQRLLIAILCLGLALVALSCTKKAPETSAPAPTPVAFGVTGVDLGNTIGGDKRVAEKLDTFKPNDTIYASVLTSGASPSAVLKARWTFEDGQVVNESEETIAPTTDAATEFHISKPDGWPAGKYKVEILLNGSTAQTKDFTVQ